MLNLSLEKSGTAQFLCGTAFSFRIYPQGKTQIKKGSAAVFDCGSLIFGNMRNYANGFSSL